MFSQYQMMKMGVRTITERFMKPAKMFGLFPISRRRRKSYCVSFASLCFTILIYIAYTLTTIFFFTSNVNISENIYLSFQMDYINMCLLNSVPIVSISELLYNLEDFNDYILCVEAVEAQLMQFGTSVVFKTSERPLLMNSLFYFVIVCCRLVKNALNPWSGWMPFFKPFYYLSLMGLMMTLVYWNVGVIGILASLFTACNQQLLMCSKDFPIKTNKFEKLVRAHHTLCSSSSLLNEVLGLQQLVVFLTCFAISVCQVYLSIIQLTSDTEEGTYLAVVVKLGLLVVCFTLCFQTVAACNLCSIEAKEFNTLLYQLMLDDKTNEVSTNQKLRLHIAMKREVVFNACGFFKLDYTLVHSMVAAATTYLVILIQFGVPSGNAVSSPLPNPAVQANTTEYHIFPTSKHQ